MIVAVSYRLYLVAENANFLCTVYSFLRYFYNSFAMNHELTFLVEADPEGGYTARALEESIFTEAETLEELRLAIKDAVECHFEPEQYPKFVRLRVVHQELLEIA